MAKLDLTVVHHPAVIEQFNRRAADVQLRIAAMFSVHDRCTSSHHAEIRPLPASALLRSASARSCADSRASLTSCSRSALPFDCAAAARSSRSFARAASLVS